MFYIHFQFFPPFPSFVHPGLLLLSSRMHLASIADERERLNWDLRAGGWWCFGCITLPQSQATQILRGRAKTVCVRRHAQTQISEVTGWRLHNKHLFCCWENQSQFFVGNLHIFNICIIPTLKTNPNISHLQCHGGFCSEAIFEEGFYMCVFLKYGIQARLGPSQHNITQYS